MRRTDRRRQPLCALREITAVLRDLRNRLRRRNGITCSQSISRMTKPVIDGHLFDFRTGPLDATKTKRGRNGFVERDELRVVSQAQRTTRVIILRERQSRASNRRTRVGRIELASALPSIDGGITEIMDAKNIGGEQRCVHTCGGRR